MCCFSIGASKGWGGGAGGGNISSHAHKTASWYLEGVLFKISYKPFHPLYVVIPPESRLPLLSQSSRKANTEIRAMMKYVILLTCLLDNASILSGEITC